LSKEIILLVGQNLFFLGRVENLAEPLGYEVQHTTTESAFWNAYGSGQIALILVDLEGDESIWRKVLEGIRQQGAGGVKVVSGLRSSRKRHHVGKGKESRLQFGFEQGGVQSRPAQNY
jgi:hypothetical protein